MQRPLPALVALLLSVLSAFLLSLAFPPWSLRALAFVAVAPLLLAIRSGGLARALVLIGLWSTLYAWGVASVFPASIARYFDRPPWFGFAVGNLLFIAMSGLYYGVFAAVDRRLVRQLRAFTPLLVAAAWVGIEIARARLLTGTPFFIGNPWGIVGYSHASGSLAQIASVTGVYGISFALVAVNAGLAGLIGTWRMRETRSTAMRGLGLALLPAAAAALYGDSVLRAAPASAPGLAEVAVVQGNVSIERRWRSDFHGKNLDVYLGLTRQALEARRPRLVVWPETAMNFFLEAEPGYLASIQRVLAGRGVPLLAGGPSGDRDRHPPYFNSAFLIDPASGIRGRYDKEVLLPFAEQIPLRGMDWARRSFEGARTFEPGPTRPPPLRTPIGRVGILICNEAMLPEVAGERVRAGAEVLVSPSHDGWIAGRAFAEHMLAVVGLRAVEQRRYLIRASTSGPSAIIDPWGRVLARSQPFTRQNVHGGVRPEREVTTYARVGDAFSGLCVSAVIATLLLGRRYGSSDPA